MSSSPDTTAAPVAPSLDETMGTAGASASVEAVSVEAVSAGGRPREFSWRRLLWTISPLAVIGLLILLEVPLCPSRNVLGLPCPGCGLTRATEAMVVGDFAAMLRLHPLAPLLTPMAIFSVVRVSLISAGALKNRTDPLSRLPKWFWGAFAVALVGLWLARMAGLFGGLPDPVDFTEGFLYRGAHGAYLLLTGQP